MRGVGLPAGSRRWLTARPARAGSRRGRLGIQARLTVAATALVALVLIGGAVVLTVALRHTLLSTLDDSARQRARDVATLVDTGNLPNTVPGRRRHGPRAGRR